MCSKKKYYHIWTELRATGAVVLLMVTKSGPDYRLVEVVLPKPLASLNQEFASMSNIGLHLIYMI